MNLDWLKITFFFLIPNITFICSMLAILKYKEKKIIWWQLALGLLIVNYSFYRSYYA